MPNDEICRITKVKDIIEKIAELKWRWTGHVARLKDERWSSMFVKWRPRETKRNIGTSTIADRNWYQKAQGPVEKTGKGLCLGVDKKWLKKKKKMMKYS